MSETNDISVIGEKVQNSKYVMRKRKLSQVTKGYAISLEKPEMNLGLLCLRQNAVIRNSFCCR